MATNIAFTSGPNADPSGRFVQVAVEGSAAGNLLNTAGDVTSPLTTNGYKDHFYNFVLSAVGTSAVVAIEALLSITGAWVEVSVSTALAANGNYQLTYSGFAVQTRLKLKTITGGSPTIGTIAAVSATRY